MCREEKPDARERLLNAGLKTFAESGYEGATFRGICDSAGVNIASINYYFKDKESFYQAVRDYARDLHHKMMERFWQTVEQDNWLALKVHIDILLEASYDERMSTVNWFRLRELFSHDNVPPHQESDEQSCKHREYDEKMTRFLSGLLGPAASPENINLLRYTYYSLCNFLPIHRQIEERLLRGQGKFNLSPLVNREGLADFIFQTVKRTVNAMVAAAAISKQKPPSFAR